MLKPILWALVAAPGINALISRNGKCGGNLNCLGSTFGDCCSQYNWCGSSADYCGEGCKSKFGKCDGVAAPSSAVRASSTAPLVSLPTGLVVSTNARCGRAHGASPDGMTCAGSVWGNCCSQYGYCGSSPDYCAAAKGCQTGFGVCDSTVSSSVAISSSAISSSVASSSIVSSSSSSALLSSSTRLSASSTPVTSSTSESSVTLSSSVSSSSALQDMTTSSVPISSPASSSPAAASSSAAPEPSPAPTPTPVEPTPSSDASPSPAPTCGVKGSLRAGVTYTNIANQDFAGCKTRCMAYTLAGRSCRVFGLNGATWVCTLALGFTAPTFEQAFLPTPASVITWYTTDCTAP